MILQKFWSDHYQDLDKIIKGSCQDVSKILKVSFQYHWKILSRSYQDPAASCRILSKILHDLTKGLAKIISKILSWFHQDLVKILPRFSTWVTTQHDKLVITDILSSTSPLLPPLPNPPEAIAADNNPRDVVLAVLNGSSTPEPALLKPQAEKKLQHPHFGGKQPKQHKPLKCISTVCKEEKDKLAEELESTREELDKALEELSKC